MAERRPIASHPAFTPLAALWFAALLGLGVAVLPSAWVARVLAAAGIGVPGAVAIGVAALLGALVGLVLGRAIARWTLRDPRPLYAQEDQLHESAEPAPEPVRRPLRVREEVSDGAEVELAAPARALDAKPSPAPDTIPQYDSGGPARVVETGLMIVAPRPASAAPLDFDLDALLARFDQAIDGFTTEAANQEPAPDPVRAFVARQTGDEAGAGLPGPARDHREGLRAALDDLARIRAADGGRTGG